MSAQVVFEIRNGVDVGEGLKRFNPGEHVSGHVTITPDKNIKARAVYIMARWHTEGRGDRDSGEVSQTLLAEGMLNRDMPLYYEFNLLLPIEPWSYAGHYINILWDLVVKIDIRLASDIEAAQRFILFPSAESQPEEDDSIF